MRLVMQVVEFLGYHISDLGITPQREKIQKLINAPTPQTVKELQCFLGMVNVSRRFCRVLQKNEIPCLISLLTLKRQRSG